MYKLSKEHAFLTIAFKNVFKMKKKYLILMLLSILMGAFVTIWPSLILKKILDLIMDQSSEWLWKMSFFYLGSIVLIGFLDFIREFCATSFGQYVLLDIRRQMLERLNLLPMKYYLSTSVGDTISRFTSDLEAVNTMLSAGMITALADLLKIIGVVVAIFILSPWIGGFAILSLPIIFLLSNFFRKNIYKRQKEVRKKVGFIHSLINEIYSGVKIIKIFGQENLFSRNFSNALESHRQSMNANSVYDAWFPCVMQIVRAIVIASVLMSGAKNNGTIFALGLSIGTLAALADLFSRLFDPIEAIAAEIQTIQQAFAGMDRLKEFFNEPLEKRMGLNEEKTTEMVQKDIKIENVSFEYSEGKKILSSVSLDILEGSKVAFVGRTGSGKTTLLMLIAGLFSPLEGRISIGGINPFTLPAKERRKLIGIVPQSTQVFDGSLLDNITLRDASITEEEVWKALKTIGLSDKISLLPDGLSTYLGDSENVLSFGELQLLSLARAIVCNPPILLLDEMTSGIDALTEKKLLDAIKCVSQRRTILTISHRISGILDADVVHILDQGKLVESGNPLSLQEKEGWYAIFNRLEKHGWQLN